MCELSTEAFEHDRKTESLRYGCRFFRRAGNGFFHHRHSVIFE